MLFFKRKAQAAPVRAVAGPQAPPAPPVRRVFLATIHEEMPQRGMEHAFRGVFGAENVAVYDYMDRTRQHAPREQINRELRDAVVAFRPDWVWTQLQNKGVIDAATLMDIRAAVPGCVVTHWMGDLRPQVGEYLSSVCRAAHLTLVSNEGQAPLFFAAGAPRVLYCPVAVDWDEDVMAQPDWEPPFRVPEVVFCGTHYKGQFPGVREREEASRALVDAGVDFGIVGHGWPDGFPVVGKCRRSQQANVYRRARVVLSVNNFNAVRRYYSNRHFVALASGRPVVSIYIPGMESDFKDGEHLLWYRDAGELVKKVKRLLLDPAERERVGTAGRTLALSSHTWFSRILSLLPKVEKIRESIGRGA